VESFSSITGSLECFKFFFQACQILVKRIIVRTVNIMRKLSDGKMSKKKKTFSLKRSGVAYLVKYGMDDVFVWIKGIGGKRGSQSNENLLSHINI
jgi:hypothetical protein